MQLVFRYISEILCLKKKWIITSMIMVFQISQSTSLEKFTQLKLSLLYTNLLKGRRLHVGKSFSGSFRSSPGQVTEEHGVKHACQCSLPGSRGSTVNLSCYCDTLNAYLRFATSQGRGGKHQKLGILYMYSPNWLKTRFSVSDQWEDSRAFGSARQRQDESVQQTYGWELTGPGLLSGGQP